MSDISKIEFTRCENFLKESINKRECVTEFATPKINNVYYGWYNLGTTIDSYLTVTPNLNKTFGVNTSKIDYYYEIAHMIVYNSKLNYKKSELKTIINKFKAENKNILRIYTKLENNNVEKYLYRIKYLRSKKLINKLIRLVKSKKFMLQ